MANFGAVRWDGYYDPSMAIARWTVAALSPQRFRHRTPLHGIEVNPERIVWQPSQATFDAEITAAAAGGLDYWIYLRYGGVNSPQNEGMNAAWELHQTSSIKNNMKWITMQQLNTLGSWNATPAYDAEVAEIVGWMQQANYKKVLGNRPLMYLMYIPVQLDTWWNSDNARVKTALDKIRTDVQAAGLGNPYIVVLQIGSPAAAEPARVALGCQAITDYCCFPSQLGGSLRGTYVSLTTTTQNYWTYMAGISAKILPVAMMGWPKFPIFERPGPWFAPPAGTQRPYMDYLNFIEYPTMPELTAHFDAAEAFVSANPSVCETGCVTIYAWNEVTEGGWLTPTYGDPDGARLAALYEALHN